jgi:carboxylate-amine ligase
MFRSTLELITDVCPNAHVVGTDLKETLRKVRKAGQKTGIRFSGTGTHPMANYQERILSRSERYHELLERNQWLIKRMAVYGLHVHLGMKDGDDCIRFNNFFLHFIPHLIALSASSPYWNCQDTGLAASRPTVYEAHPTSGIPYTVYNWKEFNDLYAKLVATKSIASMKDIWWDIRPSPVYGTLELRICDGPATMLELQSIVAFIHLLGLWFNDNRHHFYKANKIIPEQWVMRENKWRAIRYGLDARIISHETLEEKRLSKNIQFWIEKLQPYIAQMQYQPFMDCLLQLLRHGNSATRQRKVMAETNDIQQVVDFNMREFEFGAPLWN